MAQRMLPPIPEVPAEDDPDYQSYRRGIHQGREEMKVEVLGLLQERYMDARVARGSAKGEALLELAKELAEELRA